MSRFKPLSARLTALSWLAALAATFGLAATAAAQPAAPLEVVAFGDSLSAGYGVGPGKSFPEQLQAALRRQGLLGHRRQCRRFRRHLDRGSCPARLVGGRRRRPRHRRARRQRCAPRRSPAGSATRTSTPSCSVRRRELPMLLPACSRRRTWAGTTPPPSTGSMRVLRPAIRRRRSTRSSSTASPPIRSQPGRRHPSQSQGRRPCRRKDPAGGDGAARRHRRSVRGLIAARQSPTRPVERRQRRHSLSRQLSRHSSTAKTKVWPSSRHSRAKLSAWRRGGGFRP